MFWPDSEGLNGEVSLTMHDWFKWLLVIVQVLGCAATCWKVGKPREAGTPEEATVVVIVSALLVWGILAYWK